MPDTNWELRQKHTAFFQTMIGSTQQGAVAFNAVATILITLGVATAKFSGFAQGQDWAALFIALVGWLALIHFLTSGFRRAAVRINDAYRKEHGELFPGATPYPLETFLLIQNQREG